MSRHILLFSLLCAVYAVTTSSGKGLFGLKRTSNEPCEDIAEGFVERLELHYNGPDPEVVFNIVQMASGIDMRDSEEFREVVCNIVGHSATAGIDYLDHSGILEHLMRRVYGLEVAALEMFKPQLEAVLNAGGYPIPGPSGQTMNRLMSLVLQQINNLEDMGYFGLDAAAVQEAHQLISMIAGDFWNTSNLAPLATESSVEGCSAVRNTHNEMVDLMSGVDDLDFTFRIIYNVTGMDVLNKDRSGDLICNIAGSDNIRGIVDAIRAEDIFTNVLQFMYNELHRSGGRILDHYERLDAMTDEQLEDHMPSYVDLAMVREDIRITLKVFRALRALGMI